MDMQLNVTKLKQLRESHAWSQSHLAEVADISLRTIQRIEKSGIASPESTKAICAAYNINVTDLLIPKASQGEPLADATSSVRSLFNIGNMEVKATIIAFCLAFIIAFTLTY